VSSKKKNIENLALLNTILKKELEGQLKDN